MKEKLMEKNSKLVLTGKVIVCVLLIAMYVYSFTRYNQWYHSHAALKAIFFSVVYGIGIVSVLWNNSLSDTLNRIVSIAIFAVTPVMCYMIVECACSQWSSLFTDAETRKIGYHVLNILIFAFLISFVFLITNSFRIASAIGYLVAVILGMTVFYVATFRGTGFIASDIYSIGAGLDVAGEYSFAPDLGLYVAISIGAAAILVSWAFKGKFDLGIKIRIVMALLAVLLCGGFYYTFLDKYDASQRISIFKPQKSYLSMGVALTIVRSCNYLVIEKPEGYSAKAAEAIADRYADEISLTDDKSQDKPNIIMIMDESLSDMNSLSKGKIKTNKDIMPVLNSLKNNVYKGTLHQERRGGGTAIMEFEALTGNTNAFLPIGTVAYQNIIRSETPSMASQLKKEGYQGLIAYHPHKGTNYNRNNAYPLIGFEKTQFREDFDKSGNNAEYGKYISDESAFEQIIDDYEKYNERSDAPFFAFQVTMQNHSPYEYANSHEIRMTSREYYTEDLEQYLNYAHESDKALGKLINYFKECGEPTLVVYFGDHAPGLEDSSYQKLEGTDITVEQQFENQQTPLVIWANYDIGEKNYGDISENYISGEVMEAAGIQKTGYQLFLQDLRKDIVAINSIGYIGANGKFYERDDKDSPYYDKILEYSILEYNLLSDKKNRVSGFFENN